MAIQNPHNPVASSTDRLEFRTASAPQTEALGAHLGRSLRAGDLIFLHGHLGAGKTTFTRGVAQGCGIRDPREVSSPSYTLHHHYEGTRLSIDHLDLYRLEVSAMDLDRQGLLDGVRAGASATLVEWPEHWPEAERPDLSVVLEARGEEDRQLVFEAMSPRGREVLGELMEKE